MNFRILFMILVYYSIITIMFAFDTTSVMTGYSTNANVSGMRGNLTAEESGTGGIFSVGVSVARFFGFVIFGVGLAADTPGWFALCFFLWETIISLLSVAFIVNSIWSG